MNDRDETQRSKERRRRILERLNSAEDGLNEEASQTMKEAKREREYRRQLELEKGWLHPGF